MLGVRRDLTKSVIVARGVTSQRAMSALNKNLNCYAESLVQNSLYSKGQTSQLSVYSSCELSELRQVWIVERQ